MFLFQRCSWRRITYRWCRAGQKRRNADPKDGVVHMGRSVGIAELPAEDTAPTKFLEDNSLHGQPILLHSGVGIGKSSPHEVKEEEEGDRTAALVLG